MTPVLTLAPLLAAAHRIDMEASRRLARTLQAEPRHGYTNALKALHPSMQYVEGLRVGSGSLLPFDHGWLEGNGAIVDPTLPLLDPNNEEEWRYFAAFRWSHEEICALLAEHNGSILTPVQRYLPHWGKGEETWLAATLLAHRHVAAVRQQRYGVLPPSPAGERETLRGIVGDAWVAKLAVPAIDVPPEKLGG